MAQAGTLDWTDLMNGKVGGPECSLSKPITSQPNKGGEDVTEEDLKKEAEFIVDGFRQKGIAAPTSEEFNKLIKNMYPSLAMTESEWDAIEKEWLEKPNKVFEDLQKAKVQIKNDTVEDWGNCESFNHSLSKEEELERNMFVGE